MRLVLLGQVPALVIIALWLSVHHGYDQRRAAEYLSARAEALTLVLDENARGMERQLTQLAAEVPHDGGELPTFLWRAERWRRIAGLHSLVFTDAGGEQVARLPMPWESSDAAGTQPPGPDTGPPAAFGQPEGTPSLAPGSIRVQVPGSADVRWVVARLDPSNIRELLEGLGWPTTWSAAVVDARGKVVAQVGANADRMLAGMPPWAQVGGQKTFDTKGPQGSGLVTTYTQSRVPGWLAVVSAPRSEIYGSPWPASAATRLLWLLLALLALAALWMDLRLFTGLVGTARRIREQATAPAGGEDHTAFPVAFAEARLVRDRLRADAAELQLIHARLVRAEERLEAILQASTDTIIVIDGRDRILLANEAAARAFGIPSHQLVGTHADRLLAEDTFAEYLAGRKSDAAVCAPGAPRAPWVGWCRRPDGSLFPIEYSLSVFPSVMGRRFCTLVARDTTAQRENAELHRTQDEFQAALIKEAELRQAALARELHDGVASSLAGVSLLLRAARAGLGTHLAVTLIDKSQEQVVRSMEQIRQISHGIMPAGQDDGALQPALEWFAADVNRLPGISCHISCRGDFRALSGEAGGHLFRIVQEATHNALRHGNAHRIHIRLARVGDRFRLTVQDNGTGCDPRKLAAAAGGIGLASMRARARAIGGVFEARTWPGTGFRVSVTWVDRRVSSTAQDPDGVTF